HLGGALRVEDRQGPRLDSVERHVREDRRGTGKHPLAIAQVLHAALVDLPVVLLRLPAVPVTGPVWQLLIVRERADHAVTELGKADDQAFEPFVVAAPSTAARADSDQVDGAVADVVVVVADEVLGRELPVAGDAPALDAADDF